MPPRRGLRFALLRIRDPGQKSVDSLLRRLYIALQQMTQRNKFAD